MTNSYGPWTTTIDPGRNPQLSAFWKRRLGMLAAASQTSPVLSPHNLLWLCVAAALICVLPTFHVGTVVAEQQQPAKEERQSNTATLQFGVFSATMTSDTGQAEQSTDESGEPETKYDWTKISPEEYQKQWDRDLKLVDVPIKPISGASGHVLQEKLPIGAQFRVVHFRADYGNGLSTTKFPEPPAYYSVATGRIAVMPPVVADSTQLLIAADPPHTRAQTNRHEDPGGACVLILRKGGYHYYDVGHGSFKNALYSKLVLAGGHLSGSLFFDYHGYPQGKALATGVKWSGPKHWVVSTDLNGSEREITCEVAGFAEIDGRQTVKIVSETRRENPPVEAGLTMVGSSGVDPEEAKKQMEEAKKKAEEERKKEMAEQDRTEQTNETWYVDLQTGLLVRYEWRFTYHRPTSPEKGAAVVQISQVFAAGPDSREAMPTLSPQQQQQLRAEAERLSKLAQKEDAEKGVVKKGKGTLIYFDGKANAGGNKESLQDCLIASQSALSSGDLAKAGEYATKAIKIAPKSFDAKMLQGIVALCLEDYRAAELSFDDVLRQSPSNFAASNNLALALVEQVDDAKKQRGLKLAEANARQYPRLAEAASTYGWALYKNGRLDDAERELKKAAASGNVSPDTAFYLARVYVDQKRTEEAKKLLKAALGNKGLCSKKTEAKALLEELEKSGR